MNFFWLQKVTKDERVDLKILAARLQERLDFGLEDLETHISEKVADQEQTAVSAPQTESVQSSAFFAHSRRKMLQNQHMAYALLDKTTHLGSKDAKQSNPPKSIVMPTLKSKNYPPFIQKLDPVIWDSWSSSKRQKFTRLVRDFKDKVVQMLQDEEDDPTSHEQADLLVAYIDDPGAFGFGSNAF